MPGYDGSLNFNTKIDQKGFDKGTASISKSLKKLGALFATVFATKKLIDFGRAALNVASDLQEVQNVVDVVFGDMADAVNKFSKTALDQFGLSELSTKRYISSLGAMGSSMGFAADQNLEMSKTLTSLIGDFSSFYDVSHDRANLALQAVYTGETETLKRYGILITEVNLQEFARQQGIKKSIQKMTQQEKVMLRYNYVLRATENAQGDFLRTQESWANQMRILTERWKQFLGLIGKNLITVLTPALKFLNQLLATLIAATQQFNAFYTSISGKQIEQQSKVTSGIGDSIDEQNALTDAVEDTNKAIKGSLAGFDEINVLQKSAATAEGDTIEFASELKTEVSEPVESELAPVFKKIQEFFKPFEEFDLKPLNLSIQKLKDSLKDLVTVNFSDFNDFYYGTLIPLSELSIEETLPAFLNLLSETIKLGATAIDIASGPFTRFINEVLGPIALWTGGKINDILELFADKTGKLTDKLNDNRESIQGIIDKFTEFGLFLAEKLGPTFDSVTELINSVLGNLIDFVISAIGNIIGIFEGLLDFMLGVLTLDFERAVKGLWKILSNLGALIVKGLATVIITIGEALVIFVKWVYENTIKPLLKGFFSLWDGIKKDFMKVFNFIANALIDYVNGWITTVELFINFFLLGINKIIDALNTISFEIPDWVPEIGGKQFGLNLERLSRVSLGRVPQLTAEPLSTRTQSFGYGAGVDEAAIARLMAQQQQTDEKIVIEFKGDLAGLAQILQPEIKKEEKRQGPDMRRTDR